MRNIIISVIALMLAACSTTKQNNQPQEMPHHVNEHGHHIDAHGQMMPNCPMMKNFQLREMPEVELKNNESKLNEIEKQILENFSEVSSIAYEKWGNDKQGIDFKTKQSINRIQLRKLGQKIANFIREKTQTSALIEINTKINGIPVSKMY